MKQKYKFFFFFFIAIATINAQNVGIGTATPHSSAKLELSATNQGFLMTRVDPANISNPAFGLMTLSPNDSCLYLYNGLTWTSMGGGGKRCRCNCYSPNQAQPQAIRSGTWHSSTGVTPKDYNTVQTNLPPGDLAAITDGNPTTFISVFENDYACFSVDLGTSQTLSSVIISPHNTLGYGGGLLNGHPSNFVVFGSNNGNSWTIASTGFSPNGAVTKTFTMNATPYRYYSVRFNTCNSCTVYLSDIEFNL